MTALFEEYISLVVDFILVNRFGWVLFLAALIWMIYKVKKIENQRKWRNAVKQVFLEVRVDELSERSPLAMEQVFAALHAIHTNYTFGEKLDGKQILWVSCEIVSIGGKISYIIKIPERYRTLLESAIFAQYPKAEIREVEDYLINLPHYDRDETSPYEFWGTQMNKHKVNAYPIKTYGAFEHPEQKTFVDPLANVIEVMSNINPDELVAYQIVIKPVDDKWKENVKPLLNKLKGAPVKHERSGLGKVIFGITGLFAEVIDEFISGPKERKTLPPREEPPSQMLHKTEGEKQVIASIEHALTKIGYEVRMRLMYLAPKGGFNKALRVPEIVGTVRNFDDVSLNKLKPDLKHSWTDVPYRLSQKLEGPYMRYAILKRKRHFMYNFTRRSHWRGTGFTILNTEELATIYHLPVAPQVRVSQVERVQAVKSAPPADLPVA